MNMQIRMHRCSSGVRTFSATALIVFVAGCHDVEYDYNIPEDVSDCPSGMEHRSSGAGIIDRSSGAGIVDRDGDSVLSYCYVDNCSGTWDDSVAASIEWHQDDHDVVVAKRRCVASLTQPAPDLPGPSNQPVRNSDTDTAIDTDQQDDPPNE